METIHGFGDHGRLDRIDSGLSPGDGLVICESDYTRLSFLRGLIATGRARGARSAGDLGNGGTIRADVGGSGTHPADRGIVDVNLRHRKGKIEGRQFRRDRTGAAVDVHWE